MDCKAFTDELQNHNGQYRISTYHDDDIDTIFETFTYAINPKTLFNSYYGRECRGITFDGNKIVCRPFHKFFNVGEREDAHIDKINATHYSVKHDGSLICVFTHKGKVLVKTKSSFKNKHCDVAREILFKNKKLLDFIVVHPNKTFLFEIVGPANRIIVDYEKNELILLAVRHNDSGEYLWDVFDACPGKKTEWKRVDDIIGLIEIVKNETLYEGIVLHDRNDGYSFYKAKTIWYIMRHKSVSLNVKALTELFIDGKIDDVAPLIPAHKRILFSEIVDNIRDVTLDTVNEVADIIQEDGHLDRKTFAIKHSKHRLFGLIMPAYLDKDMRLKKYVVGEISKLYTNEQIFNLEPKIKCKK